MILFVARAGRKNGIGHFRRMETLISLTEDASVLAVLLPAKEIADFRTSPLGNRSQVHVAEGDAASWKAALDLVLPVIVVLDIREAPRYLLDELRRRAIPFVSWDDTGAGREEAEALLSPLPSARPKSANYETPEWLPLAVSSVRTVPAKADRLALVSFGGSDPSDSARLVLTALYENGAPEGWKILAVEGPLADYSRWKGNFPEAEFLHAPDNLTDWIALADLVFTSVGMTLSEARSLGKPAVLLTPARYHSRIAAAAAKSDPGVTFLGRAGRVKAASIRKALGRAPGFGTETPGAPSSFDFRAEWNRLLGRLIDLGSARCPVCGSSLRTAVHRATDHTLYRCRRCGTSHKYFLREPAKAYDESYFGTNHAAAYGKTYLEDEPAIREFSRRRLDVIRALLPPLERPSLLDCGSALGVFASEAVSRGFDAKGLEISEHARGVARERFGVESFADVPECGGPFDAVTMWFFLEHMDNPEAWLLRARGILADGGILALGLPSAGGPLARFNTRLYAKIRPEEHYFEPSPEAMRRLVRKCGFEVLKTECFGLHPDRAGLPRWKGLMRLQKRLELGDTFELYARKLPAPR